MKPFIRITLWPALVLVWLLSLTPAARAGSVHRILPFSQGEVITYAVRWQQLHVGSAEVSVLPFTEVNGKKAYHFRLALRGNDFLDTFYKVRDVMDGFVDYGLAGSLLYTRNATGKDKKQIRVEFFPEKNQVVYSNFGGKRDPVEIPKHTVDPVSSYFYMRVLPLEVGKTVSFPVSDGKKSFIQSGAVKGTETIITPGGSFEAFVVVPSTSHYSGIFEKSDDPSVRVWISTDKRRLPVRIKIGVLVGSIVFDLVSVENRPFVSTPAQSKSDLPAPVLLDHSS